MDEISFESQIAPQAGDTAPNFIIRLIPTVANEGDTVTLSCQTTGIPRPKTSWFCDREYIFPSEDFMITESESGLQELIIREVFHDDEGTYICRATNRVGSTVTSAFLSIKSSVSEEIPMETIELEKMTVEEYSEYLSKIIITEAIEVTINRYQLMEIKELVEQEQEEILYSPEEPRISKEEDGDRTTVRVSSKKIYREPKATETSSTFYRETQLRIAVEDEPVSDPVQPLPMELPAVSGCPPEFVQPLGNMVVMEGETARMKAIIAGFPIPEVMWFVDGDRISPSR